MTIHQNGEAFRGRIGLGSPGTSGYIHGLARQQILEFGVSLEPGDIVISGGITKMLPVKAGDEFLFRSQVNRSLTVTFS